MNVMLLEQVPMSAQLMGMRPSLQWVQPQLMMPQASFMPPQIMMGVNRLHHHKQLDNYTILLDQPVGTGSFSVVYRAKDNRNGE